LPKVVSASARRLVVRAATTFPVTLHVGSARFQLDARPRNLAIRLKAGRGALRLALGLFSGRARSTVSVVIPRR
jgi:hypothetical protein